MPFKIKKTKPSWCHNIDHFACLFHINLSLAVQPNCLKGRVVCGNVSGDMHLKDLLGSIAKVPVGYHILVPDFYLVLHGPRCRKSTINQSTCAWLANNVNLRDYTEPGLLYLSNLKFQTMFKYEFLVT